MLRFVHRVKLLRCVLNLGNDHASPDFPGGLGEHEGSEVVHKRGVRGFLGGGDQPAPSPVVRDGAVLPEERNAVVSRP